MFQSSNVNSQFLKVIQTGEQSSGLLLSKDSISFFSQYELLKASSTPLLSTQESKMVMYAEASTAADDALLTNNYDNESNKFVQILINTIIPMMLLSFILLAPNNIKLFYLANQKKGITLAQAFLAGSITSSCCLIQLILNFLSSLNILHVGCAGFNKILGPLRPITRFMTLAWLGITWISLGFDWKSCCSATASTLIKGRRNKLFFSTFLTIMLMFLPELLKMTTSRYAIAPATTVSSLTKQIFVIDNMGCEACVNGVERILNRHAGVVQASVSSFDRGEVEIFFNTDWNFDKQALNETLKQHGYELQEHGWVTKKMKRDEKLHSGKQRGSNDLFFT